MPDNVNFNLTDIADAVKIIDFAAEQGAFKGWSNIRQILAVRDRLELFVASVTAAQNEQLNNPAAVLDEADQPVVTQDNAG